MIKFFRNIRQKLLLENKIGNYLKYAVGEIFLVVIGILIALQINNWNEDRLNNIEEASYYCNFLEDVYQDKLMLATQRNKALQRLHYANKLMENLLGEDTDLFQISINLKEAVSTINNNLKPTMAAFEDLKSSGSLKIIRDRKIKNALINYYSNAEGVLNVINDNSASSGNRMKNIDDRLNAGFVYLIEDQNGFDTSMIDVDKLKAMSEMTTGVKRNLINDALAYIGTNSRNLVHFDSFEKEISTIEILLKAKCIVND